MPEALKMFLMYLIVIGMLLVTLTIHELGHFIFAVAFKVNVKEYSIGVGPALFSKKTKNQMKVSFRLIPIMAYVLLDSKAIRKMYAAEPNDKNYDWFMLPTPRNKILLEDSKTWQYNLIMFGGVMLNFVLCLFIMPFSWWANHANGFQFSNPFVGVGLSFYEILKNMVFIGGGSIFGSVPGIAADPHWGIIILYALMMMNLVTAIFNLIPIPPLDGYKIYAKEYEVIKKKPIKEKTETYLLYFGLALFIYIFVSSIINDFIPRNDPEEALWASLSNLL